LVSPEAEKLFGTQDDEEDAHQAAINIISQINGAFNTNILFLVQGFSEEKVGATGEKKRVLIKSEIRKHSSEALIRYQRDIIQQAAYLRALLQEAVQHDGEKSCLNWRNCAKAAIVKMRDAGFDRIKNCETLLTWFRQFRDMATLTKTNLLESRKALTNPPEGSP
jgi:hypothetical protein